MKPILYVGNKNYSSWSLRAWLVLRWGRIEFTERLIQLDQSGYGEGGIEEVLAVSPSGRVPALATAEVVVHDSLAIAEWAAELQPDLWPEDGAHRAQARSVTCEMHSGFPNLRQALPMNLHRRSRIPALDGPTQHDVDRVTSLWGELRQRFDDAGPWLFGTRSIADAFYLPVASRFRTYGIQLGEAAREYCATVLADPDFLDWERDGVPDSWDVSGYSVIDGLYR